MSNDKRIGDLLVDAGVVSRDALEALLQRKPQVADRRLLSELYAAKMAGERQLADVLARRVGAPVAVLTESAVDLDVVRMVPAEVMREHVALPVAADEHSVTVVTPDPDAPGLLVPLAFATGRRVVLLLGIHSVLEEHLERALEGVARGERLLVGRGAGQGTLGDGPHLEVARYTPAVGLEEANAIARAIVDALTEPPKGGPVPDWEPPSMGTQIGAVRLKQMLIERKREAGAGEAGAIIERVRAVSEPIAEAPALVLDAEVLPEAAPVTVEEIAEPGQPVVLVVDDDEAIRGMLLKAFRHDGCVVLEAKDGEEALTLLRLTLPDVVVLDAMLPAVHGFEICAGLKRSQHKDVPVIMISAIYRGWMKAREIQEVHGADYFVEKPFELTFVRKLLAEILKRPHAPYQHGGHLVDRAKVTAVKARYEMHTSTGRFAEAARDVEEWISLDPFDGRAWFERGNLCARAEDLVGAMAAFEAAVVYDADAVVAHLGLAMVYEQLGFVRRARSTWERARALAPDDDVRARIDAHLRK